MLALLMLTVKIRLTYKIIVLPWQELQPSGLGGERPKRNCEIHQFVWLVAYGDYSRVGVRYAAGFVLLLGHVVNYVLLGVFVVGPRHVHGADDVHLVVLELDVALVHVYYVICIVYSKSERKKK